MTITFGSAARRATALCILAVVLLTLSVSPTLGAVAQVDKPVQKPTIVLVHGAWADASSWSNVITRLHQHGYKVAAVANPLRSLSSDAAYFSSTGNLSIGAA
uniref:hypothetical protein n=1 Tax=Lentzea alba TaxID=2714351 RepID=UPI0039BF294E